MYLRWWCVQVERDILYLYAYYRTCINPLTCILDSRNSAPTLKYLLY